MYQRTRRLLFVDNDTSDCVDVDVDVGSTEP